MDQPAGHHLAQLNIGRLRYEASDPRMADFVDNLAFVNGLAERSEGFVWRYQDDSGSAIDTRPFDGDPRMAINMSVWTDGDALARFVWQTVHKRFYGQRHDWFETMDGLYFVMWWVSRRTSSPPYGKPSSGSIISSAMVRAIMPSIGKVCRRRKWRRPHVARERRGGFDG